MSLFSALNTAYTGLQSSQVNTDTIGNNISNAENEDYTRQRVDVESKQSLTFPYGQVGTGVETAQIIRIHDEFTFKRYVAASSDQEFSQMEQKILVELSQYFPDVDKAGLERDLVSFFESWQKLASNPADDAQKIAVAASANQLSLDIKDVYEKFETTQKSIDEMLKQSIDEVNRLAKEIAGINKEIKYVEAHKYRHANTLRDERDKLETTIAKLIDPTITKSGTQSLSSFDSNIADFEDEYGILAGGFQIVDGTTYHPLKAEASSNSNKGYRSVFFQKSDHTLADVSNKITGGKVGAMLELRGKSFSSLTGEAEDGKIQKYKDMLDSFSRGLIQSVNTVYAVNADSEMNSSLIGNTVSLNVDERQIALKKLYPEELRNRVIDGNMVFTVYDLNGNVIKDVKVALNPLNESLEATMEAINKKFKAENIDAKAILELGTMKIATGEMYSGEKVGAVLIKEDNTLIVEALDLTGYKEIKKVNNLELPFNIEDGEFDINVYNENGDVMATRTIKIDKESGSPLYSTINGVVAQINMKNIDDNHDNYFSNDVDDLISANFSGNKLHIYANDTNKSIEFNIRDKGTGFAGAIGLHKFLDGDGGGTIKLYQDFKDDPSKINAYGKGVLGDNEVANMMQQLQYDDVNFYDKRDNKTTESIMGQYRYMSGTLASDTHTVELQLESTTAVYQSIQKQQNSISAVSIDEELSNLIKYQTGYGANAKVLSTVQTMLDSLLGIKM